MAASPPFRDEIQLLGGAYQSRSIISGAQRSINLYPEINDDPQAPVKVSHFPTPGKTLKASPPALGPTRCLYRASNGSVYQVVGPNVYFVSPLYAYTLLGVITDLVSMVSMSDNGLAIVLVDGTANGWAIKMADNSFAQINDPNFFGGVRADYVDTFFTFNTPGTNYWQISLSLVTFENLTAGVITVPNAYPAFDPLDISSKVGSPDPIVSVIVMRRNPWLIGALTTEPCYNSGAADFPLAPVPGTFVEHGCIAPYSVARTDLSIFWLSQDREGKALVLRGSADYGVSELSSKGIEAILQALPVITDAIGGCFQINGHAFYVITFPTANRTFAVELKTGQWHELAWTDGNGNLVRDRANAWAFANGINLCADWQNGNIYQIDPQNFTDNDNPITRLRTIPHFLNKGKVIEINTVIADVQGGTLTSATPDNPPKIFLRVSRDRGGSFGNPIEGEFGAAGDYAQMPMWRNLGIARDWVLELFWSEPINTVLNRVFIDWTPADQ